MRSHDHYERLRKALMDVALDQSNASDRERWLALALGCLELDRRDTKRPTARRTVNALNGRHVN